MYLDTDNCTTGTFPEVETREVVPAVVKRDLVAHKTVS